MFFFLDCTNSVGVSELSVILDVFILVWNRRENDPIYKNVSVLIFRLVRQNSEDDTGNKNSVTREDIKRKIQLVRNHF